MKVLSFLLVVLIFGWAGWFFLYSRDAVPELSEYDGDVILADEIAWLEREEQIESIFEEDVPKKDIAENTTASKTDTQITENTKDTKKTPQKDETELLAVLDTPISPKTAIDLGDEYAASFQYDLARVEYLKALKERPNDIELTHKLARTYFALKRFQNVVDLYKNKAKNFDDDLRRKYILSLFYTTNFKSESSIETLKLNIQNKGLSPHEEFYYMTSAHCAIDFHECKKRFQDFFASTEYTLPQLQKIANAVAFYEASQMGGIYFKDMVLIREFYHEKLFTLSTHLAIFMLKVPSDCREVILWGEWSRDCP